MHPKSPRRRELLEQIGLDFAVLVSEVEERITEKDPSGCSPAGTAEGKSGGRTAGTGDSGDRCGYGGGIRGQNHGKTEKRGGGLPDVETAAGKYPLCFYRDGTDLYGRDTR